MEKEDAIVKKFSEDGVVFKGKLIGIDPVTGPRGDKMCHSAMQRLKAVAKGKGSHKERITISISFDGIKVVNEKTSDVVSHQRIPMISYISRDTSDTRSFGYVCGSPDTGHQFVAIKTEKSAIPVMKTIGELFKYVYEKKKREMNSTSTSSDNGAEHILSESGNNLSVPSLNASQDLSNNGLTKSPSPTPLGATERYAKWEDFNDSGNTSDLDKSGSKIRTRKTSSASSASGGGFPLLPAPTSPKRKHGRKLLTSGGSGSGGDKKSEEAKFSDLFDSDFSDIVLTPPVPTVNSLPGQSQPFSPKYVSSGLFDTNNLFSTPVSDTFKPVEPTPALPLSELKQLSDTDRYAAFNEIHSIPSVFDSVLKTNDEATKSNENLFSTDFNNGYKSDPSKPGQNFNNTHYKMDGTMSPSSNLFSSGFDANSATMSPPARKAFANTPFSTPFDDGWTHEPTGAFQEIPKPSQPLNTFGDDADFFRNIAASSDATYNNQNGFEKSKSNGRLEASNNSLDMLFSDSFLFESFNSTKSFTEFKNHLTGQIKKSASADNLY